MFKGFKEFISRGNVIDMAVGVVMGTAVTAVVTSIVANFINPLVAMIFGKSDMSNLLILSYGGASIKFGSILTALINFFIISVAVYFFIVLPMNKMREITSKKEEDVSEEKRSREDIELETLQEIRDLLKKQNEFSQN